MQVVASELSLLAFILLVFMVFSKKWLYPSGSRFFQRCPVNVTNRIYTSVYAMSMGLLYTCKSWSCFNKGSGKGEILSLAPSPKPVLTLVVVPVCSPSLQSSFFDLQVGYGGASVPVIPRTISSSSLAKSMEKCHFFGKSPGPSLCL
jgi:hypothetical protein